MDLLIGNKPIKKYLLYALTTVQKESKLVLKARGRAITKAVDLAEILKRKLPEVMVSDVTINTAIITNKETERPLRLSSMEITLVINKNKE